MNETVFFFFYSFAHQSAFFDGLTVFVANYLPYLVILSAGLFLLWHQDVLFSQDPIREFANKWQEILFVFFASGIAWALARILKVFIHADRPSVIFSDVSPLFLKTDGSFPSGHATFFFALATAIFLKHKKVGYLFIFLALLIGIARVIAGVHFPVDILAGLILGAGIAYLLKSV